jgi:hypothetical protein
MAWVAKTRPTSITLVVMSRITPRIASIRTNATRQLFARISSVVTQFLDGAYRGRRSPYGATLIAVRGQSTRLVRGPGEACRWLRDDAPGPRLVLILRHRQYTAAVPTAEYIDRCTRLASLTKTRQHMAGYHRWIVGKFDSPPQPFADLTTCVRIHTKPEGCRVVVCTINRATAGSERELED